MIRLEYYNGKEWVNAGEFNHEWMAWVSLGDDNINYRTVDENGTVITDNSKLIDISHRTEEERRHKIAKENFVKEYAALCRKWGLFIVSDDPYCAVDVESIHLKPELHSENLKILREN